jgi:hypothetical protein
MLRLRNEGERLNQQLEVEQIQYERTQLKGARSLTSKRRGGGGRWQQVLVLAADAPQAAMEKVANRHGRVWHGATENRP